MAAFLFRESEREIPSQRKAHYPDSLVSNLRLDRDVASSIVQNRDVLEESFRLIGRTPFPGTIEIVRDEDRVSGCGESFENPAFSPIPFRSRAAVHQHHGQ